MPPVVALLTDFGSQDHYVGSLKGAILSVCRDATLVDLAHELPVHDVAAGAFALAASWRDFPEGTIFLAVVDPGVGTARRALALQAEGRLFVGPDNGILSLVMEDAEGDAAVREITNAGMMRPEISATFHARDVFGPVAGHLATGVPMAEVGPLVGDPVRLAAPSVQPGSPAEWSAVVLHVDRFGNLITSLTRRELGAILSTVENDRNGVVVALGDQVLPLAVTYADVAEGEACALLGSSGRLEIAVNQGSAAQSLGAGAGSPVRLRAVSAVL
ncbi:MAG: SAM-dependent chlorinase/fluorinase [Vicinamibacteria bacterium]